MSVVNWVWWVGVLALGCGNLAAAEAVQGRSSLVLRGDQAQVTMDLAGGSIGEFRLKDRELNPLNWAAPREGEQGVRGFGHFLCLDRWGPPSDAEGRNGMPYHGEAPNVHWQSQREVRTEAGFVTASASARLPLAGLSVKRTLRLSTTQAYCVVREEVHNDNPLGRVFNWVQHPTIGRPFLDETTLVDCNGRRGFAQGGAMPNPEEPSSYWPQILDRDGQSVNLRRLTSNAHPNVVSFAVEGEWGWITAATPGQGLLIGYIWRTRDYPWVSVWRDVQQGRPSARGLEFGTTGLHQPFPILTRKGTIFERPLFEYLDAGESRTKSFGMFLCPLPADFSGVASLEVLGTRLVLHERDRDASRDLRVDAVELP